MGFRTPRLDLYDPETLKALGQAFDAAWTVLQTRHPLRDFQRDSALKIALGLRLTELAESGVTNPVELEERALGSIMLNQAERAAYAEHLLNKATNASSPDESFDLDDGRCGPVDPQTARSAGMRTELQRP